MISTDGRSAATAMRLQGDAMLAQNRFAEARDHYAQACSADRSDGEANLKLAYVEWKLGNFETAEKEARRAVRRSPKLMLPHRVLALALHSQKQYGAAIQSYKAAIKIQPKLPETHYLLATALHDSGRVPEAESSYRRALSEKPDYVQAMEGLAAILVSQMHYVDAEMLLTEALKHNPQSVEALANMAAVREHTDQVDDALQLYRQACTLAPARSDVAVTPLERQRQSYLERHFRPRK